MADLLAILCAHHVGAANAATGRVLLQQLRQQRPRAHLRRVGEAVAALIDLGVPIASSSTDRPGYFIPANEAERKRACRELDGRIAKLARRKKAFMRAGRPTKQFSLKLPRSR
jgi:hypothetical protein